MSLEIIHIGDPLLRQVSRPVTVEELASPKMQTFIDELIESMHLAGGVGIAAVQVANPIQICVIEVAANKRYPYMPDLPLQVMVNPQLSILDERRVINYDGCLSVPGLRAAVERPLALRAQYWDRFGQAIDMDYFGLAAVIVSHECDHLQGVLFPDRVTDPKTFCTWEMYDRELRASEAEKWQTIQSQFPIAAQKHLPESDCDRSDNC